MTAEYVIAELAEGQTGGFRPRGALKELWQSRDFATFVSGPAETGKTWGCLQYADALLWKYAGAQGVMCRKTYSSLVGSAVRTYLRIIGPETPIRPYGGEKPEWFQYPNGSRFWVAGMDNPGKSLSSERDFIYVNQGEELALNDFETLTTRCTGRGAVMPYTRIFGDCNPGAPLHWIKRRQREGGLKLIESRHPDNPTLYTDGGELTPQGRRTMAVLDALTGHRRLRLRDGKWASAEGLVYENYDPATHLIPTDRIPGVRRHVASVDWGFTNPGVVQVWAVDGDGRMYLAREVVRTRKTIPYWIGVGRELNAEFHPEVFACDPAEPSYIEQFQGAGLPAVAGFNDIEAGVDAMRRRFDVANDGKARIYLSSAALTERDEELAAAKLPIGLIEELDGYAYPKGVDGRPVKETPLDVNNHSCDTARYAVAYVDGIGRPRVGFASPDWYFSTSSKSRR